MPRKARDYAAEYARRKARGRHRGFTLSQIRGHPKPGEAALSLRKRLGTLDNEKLQRSLRVLRQEKSLSTAARSVHVSPERLKHAAAGKGAITKQGRRWIVNPDLPRRILIYSRGRALAITVGDVASASRVGSYMSAVARFLENNDLTLLQPFAGQSVPDISGKTHVFETNPNILYRISSAGGETFEQVYRVVV